MPIIHDDAIQKYIRKKFLLPIISLTVVSCLVILVFSILLFKRIQNSNVYFFGEMLILLAVLTAIIFITRYVTRSLMNEVLSAEEKTRAKEIFLAHMSHEIRTPMNVILGISEIQLLNKNLAAEAEEGYRKIYESCGLLLNIINDILDFSKIDAGKLEITREEYDIPSLINDSAQLNRLRFDTKPIFFNVNLDENTPHSLIGDELRIKQILNNLLSNAFKYTKEGEVELFVSAETHNDETVTLIFRVKDTGQGMTESQVSRIFDEYTRFNLETNRSISGTGLGMSITKQLINMMGGEILVESKYGEGSVFTVRLPQVRCGASVCGYDTAKNLREFNFHNTSLKKKLHIIHEYMPYGKVLLVDDVESNLLVAKGLLAPYGLQIEAVNSGIKAIEKIKNNKNYDIIFMDHMMPGIDGLKTTKIMRDMGYTHPIIALTANAVIGQEELFLSNGFDGFISKPIDSHKLNRILIEFISSKKPEMENEDINPIADSLQMKQPADETIKNGDFAAAAALDIKNAIMILEDIFPKIIVNGNAGGGADMNLFITIVHGMKSALVNIGETQLSDIALRLEQAAVKNCETAAILKETTGFLITLGSFLEKIKHKEADGSAEFSHDDYVFLQKKMKEIKTACQTHNLRAAKTALSELKQKTWPQNIINIISEISLFIIRGDYSKAVSAADFKSTTPP